MLCKSPSSVLPKRLPLPELLLYKSSRTITNSASLPNMIIKSDTLFHIPYQRRHSSAVLFLQTKARNLGSISKGYEEYFLSTLRIVTHRIVTDLE